MGSTEKITGSLGVKAGFVALNILWVLGWIAGGLSLILFLVVTFTDFGVTYIQLPVEVTLDEPIGGGRIEGDLFRARSLPVVGYKQLKVEADNARFLQPFFLVIPMALVAGMLWIIYQLRKVFDTVRDGKPFVAENSTRLRRIGYLVTFGGPVFGIFNYIYAKVHIHLLDIPNAHLAVDKDVFPLAIFLGLVILVIARVFDIGVRLQHEQDLTI